jgi:glyoxylase-like metal-dependent hydrolase (beta-lactamase superfamily II)
LIDAKRFTKTPASKKMSAIAALALTVVLVAATQSQALTLCAFCMASARSSLSLPVSADASQPEVPEWCRTLPRPEFKSLQRILPSEPWFEIYKVAPNTIAIYEPHQSEETIAYLIMGTKQAVLFDTGMGIGNIHALVTRLTSRPIVVLNSHTHNDHIGGNWQFPYIFGMDSSFTRANTKGESADAHAEIAPDQICGDLPKNFDPKSYATKPWHVSIPVHDGFKVNLGGRTVEVIATPGHTPDSICLLDSDNGLLFTGDTYYPGTIWLYRPETDLDAYVASVKKIAALAPDLKVVLGAHNVPVAQPSVLPRLVTAIEAIRAGQGDVKSAGPGKAVHTFDGFSFLLKASQ